MSHIGKPDINSVRKMNPFSVRTATEQFRRAVRIRNGIQRHIFRLSGTLCLSIPPFRLKLLNVGTVAKHDLTEIAGGISGKNSPLKAPFVQ